MQLRPARAFVDVDSGEIVSLEVMPEGIQLRTINPKSIEAFRQLKNDMLDIHSEDVYDKKYPRFMDMVVEMDLSHAETEIFLVLQSFCVQYASGQIVHENGVSVRGQHIIEKATLSPKSCYVALRSLAQKGIIALERDGRNDRYYMNPFIIERGNEISVELYLRFQDSEFAKAAVSRMIKKKRKEKSG